MREPSHVSPSQGRPLSCTWAVQSLSSTSRVVEEYNNTLMSTSGVLCPSWVRESSELPPPRTTNPAACCPGQSLPKCAGSHGHAYSLSFACCLVLRTPQRCLGQVESEERSHVILIGSHLGTSPASTACSPTSSLSTASLMQGDHQSTLPFHHSVIYHSAFSLPSLNGSRFTLVDRLAKTAIANNGGKG
jgi:hypothetical protein